MVWPVAILAVLSVVGGLIQFAPVWHPFTDWLEPVARPLAEPSNTDEAIASILAVLLGLAGIGVAAAIYARDRMRVPRVAALQRLLEHKFYFDELYDALFFRPSSGIARGFLALVERPLVGGSVSGVAATVRGLGFETRRLQTGLVRTYALAIAASAAVLTIVFVAVR